MRHVYILSIVVNKTLFCWCIRPVWPPAGLAAAAARVELLLLARGAGQGEAVGTCAACAAPGKRRCPDTEKRTGWLSFLWKKCTE